jgi:putative spermidine/putrescine transport system substrate-binding protein
MQQHLLRRPDNLKLIGQRFYCRYDKPIVGVSLLVQDYVRREAQCCDAASVARGFHRIRFCLALFALLISVPVHAQDKLVVSIWGGSWRDLIAETVAKKFTADTGVAVDFVTGGTIDRLNKEKLAKGNPESDITFTTSHVGWLYANDGLFETLDTSKIPNAKNLADEARISPYHLGAWAYVYTIGYRSDLIKDIKFESWNDLWSPELKGKLAAPDFDPSHIIAVSAMLSGADAAHWEKGQDKLRALKPNFKAFYTNDANSQQLLASGETPVQIVLSMNAYYMIGQGVPITLAIPKEGAVLGIDTVAIMKGSKKADLAYKFINTLYDPEIQAEIAKLKKGSPAVLNAKLDPEIAKLPWRLHHRRAMEAADQYRLQAARREDGRMAQMVCREYHELIRRLALSHGPAAFPSYLHDTGRALRAGLYGRHGRGPAI